MTFLLFAGGTYYPSGGMADFVSTFRTIDDAKMHIDVRQDDYDWAHIAQIVGTDDNVQSVITVAKWSSGVYGMRAEGGIESGLFFGWRDFV